jgi:hypothetical protein
MVGYQLGNTDKFKGTGVWSGVTLERKPSTAEADEKQLQQTAVTGSNAKKPPTSSTTPTTTGPGN